MDTLTFFKRANAGIKPNRTQRSIQLKAEKTRTTKTHNPDGTGKRGRKKVEELRVIKYVRLTPLHLAVLNTVKHQLRTKSTSRAIKFCIEQWGRSNDSTVSQDNG